MSLTLCVFEGLHYLAVGESSSRGVEASSILQVRIASGSLTLLTSRSRMREDDEEFRVAEREPRPTKRCLLGVWWSRDWKAVKMVTATKPEGDRRALFLLLERNEIRERNGSRCHLLLAMRPCP